MKFRQVRALQKNWMTTCYVMHWVNQTLIKTCISLDLKAKRAPVV